jgi:uncharacterized protein (DUF2345 family)
VRPDDNAILGADADNGSELRTRLRATADEHVYQLVLIAARTRVLISAGGATLTMENGGVVIHCPGEFRVRAAKLVLQESQPNPVALPALPQSKPLDFPDTRPFTDNN